MTNKDLDRLEALHGAATKGEWCYGVSRSGRPQIYARKPNGSTVQVAMVWGTQENPTGPLGSYIASAHNALPALIAEIRRLQADLIGEREAVVKVMNLCADGENPEILGRPGSPFNEAIKRLGPKAEIERLREYDWRPIAEAPTNGVAIEAYDIRSGFCRVVGYRKGSWLLLGTVDNYYAADYFTHFRLLRGPEGV